MNVSLFLLAFQAAGAAEAAVPWATLSQYGPAGLIAGGLISAAKILVFRMREEDKKREEMADKMLARLEVRDRSHEDALKAIAAALADVVKDQKVLAIEQARTGLLVAALGRIVSTPDGQRIAAGEMRELVKSINEELGR